ncbi:MAG: methyltransferase domain-containing protein [Thermoleophilia bacterium]
MLDEFLKANLGLWNEWTQIHETSAFYDLEGFRAGASSLHSIERDELDDVAGKRLLHLQCHFGLDTLSWARLGATVTGVDFSERSIELARSLSAELALPATFVQSTVDELESNLTGVFDVVYTSYGAIEWLADLQRWAHTIAHFLAPGGTFYMVELHPLARALDDLDAHPELRVVGPYFPASQPRRLRIHGSYAEPDAHVENDLAYGWSHSFAEILNALIGAGLRLEYLHEFPCSVVPFGRSMERAADGWYYLPGGRRDVPFLFSLKATKAAPGEPGTRP